ncbi:MAG: decarboxylase [Bacillota bacterium]
MYGVEKWVQKYGSPLYVYDLSQVRFAYHLLKKALPDKSNLFYSLKANPHPDIVREAVQLGCGCEISSIRELTTALSVGSDPRKCLYTGPGKTEQELIVALEKGIRSFSVESEEELQTISRLLPGITKDKINIVPRLNPNFSEPGSRLIMTGKSSPFGVERHELKKIIRIAVCHSQLDIHGFHIFSGTNTDSADNLFLQFKNAAEHIYNVSNEMGINPQVILLGGGFGHAFAKQGEFIDFSSMKCRLETVLNQLFPNWKSNHPFIYFETGRYLTSASGTLFSRILNIKESKGKIYLVMDTGINHLAGMAGLQRVISTPVEFHAIEKKQELMKNDSSEYVTVVGPLCTPLDVLAKNIQISSVSTGEILAVPNVGAYGLTASLIAFLSKENPIELVVDNDKVISVSRLEIMRNYYTDIKR